MILPVTRNASRVDDELHGGQRLDCWIGKDKLQNGIGGKGGTFRVKDSESKLYIFRVGGVCFYAPAAVHGKIVT